MKNIYLLEPIEEPRPWFDRTFGMAVIAADEAEARSLADAEVIDWGDSTEEPDNFWLDATLTKCELLGTATGNESQVVLVDFRAS